MTFFAVAWDSFREATDRSISTIMAIISVLIGLMALMFGFPASPVEDLVRVAAREAGYPKSAHVVRVDERTVDLSLVRPPAPPEVTEPPAFPEAPQPPAPRRRGPQRIGGSGDLVVDGGEGSETPVLGRPNAARAAERVRQVLERRGVKRVTITEPTGPGTEDSIRLALDYDPMATRGGGKVSILVWSFNLEWPINENMNIYGGSSPGEALWLLEGMVIDILAGLGGLLVAVIATSGFVPSMVAGGTAHLLLAKPVRRPTLFLGKYAGGLAFVAFHALVLTSAIVAAVFVRTGIFEARLFFAPLSLMSVFAVLYAASCLAGIVFETAVVSIFAAITLWILSFCAVTAHKVVHNLDQVMPGERIEIPDAARKTVDAVYFVMPKTGDVSEMFLIQMSKGHVAAETQRTGEELQKRLDPATVIGTTVGFTLMLLGIACWVFNRKDY